MSSSSGFFPNSKLTEPLKQKVLRRITETDLIIKDLDSSQPITDLPENSSYADIDNRLIQQRKFIMDFFLHIAEQKWGKDFVKFLTVPSDEPYKKELVDGIKNGDPFILQVFLDMLNKDKLINTTQIPKLNRLLMYYKNEHADFRREIVAFIKQEQEPRFSRMLQLEKQLRMSKSKENSALSQFILEHLGKIKNYNKEDIATNLATLETQVPQYVWYKKIHEIVSKEMSNLAKSPSLLKDSDFTELQRKFSSLSNSNKAITEDFRTLWNIIETLHSRGDYKLLISEDIKNIFIHYKRMAADIDSLLNSDAQNDADQMQILQYEDKRLADLHSQYLDTLHGVVNEVLHHDSDAANHYLNQFKSSYTALQHAYEYELRIVDFTNKLSVLKNRHEKLEDYLKVKAEIKQLLKSSQDNMNTLLTKYGTEQEKISTVYPILKDILKENERVNKSHHIEEKLEYVELAHATFVPLLTLINELLMLPSKYSDKQKKEMKLDKFTIYYKLLSAFNSEVDIRYNELFKKVWQGVETAKNEYEQLGRGLLSRKTYMFTLLNEILNNSALKHAAASISSLPTVAANIQSSSSSIRPGNN